MPLDEMPALIDAAARSLASIRASCSSVVSVAISGVPRRVVDEAIFSRAIRSFALSFSGGSHVFA